VPGRPGTGGRGLVTVHSDSSEVRGRDTVHIVRHTQDGDRCTCVWFATHSTGRGACKHILAARLSRSNASAGASLKLGERALGL
jgi:hypothetical protein